jgi:hypothetical protein
MDDREVDNRYFIERRVWHPSAPQQITRIKAPVLSKHPTKNKHMEGNDRGPGDIAY